MKDRFYVVKYWRVPRTPNGASSTWRAELHGDPKESLDEAVKMCRRLITGSICHAAAVAKISTLVQVQYPWVVADTQIDGGAYLPVDSAATDATKKLLSEVENNSSEHVSQLEEA